MDEEKGTKQLQGEVEALRKEIADMRAAKDLELNENLRRRSLQGAMLAGVVDNATSNENDSTSIPDAGGTVYHNQQYDKRVRVEIDGTDYYIGLYNV